MIEHQFRIDIRCPSSFRLDYESNLSISIQYIFVFLLALSPMNLLASFAAVFILLNQWNAKGSIQMFEHEQLVRNTWPWAYTALCFSCGYFAYDQWDMLKYELYSGWFPSILAHHLILLVCFSLALYRNVTINYLILTLICEVYFLCSS